MSNSMTSTDSEAELPSLPPAGAAWAGGVIDDGADLPEQLPHTLDEKRQLADLFWVDTLLKQVLGPTDRHHQELLIQNVQQALNSQQEPVPEVLSPSVAEQGRSVRPARRIWMTSAASLAAVLLAGLFLFWPDGAPGTALAAVERSLLVALDDIDREYRVQITRANAVLVPPGTLTVHGSGRYVFAQPGPIGVLYAGTNGKDYWLVPPAGPVHVAPEGSLIERLLSERQVSTPILSLATVLEQLRDRYSLELLADEQIPSPDDATRLVRCQHLSGRLQQESEVFAPRTIEVWCDRSSGVVQQMVLGWPAGSKSGMLQCEVRLQPSPGDLPADFYDHYGHHTSQRPVIPLPAPLRAPPAGLKLPPLR